MNTRWCPIRWLKCLLSVMLLLCSTGQSCVPISGDNNTSGSSGGTGGGSSGGGSSSSGGSTGSGSSGATNERLLYAVADTYAESMSPTSNFGSGQALYTGFVNFGVGRDDYFTAFVKFDLSSLPSGAQIEEARLKLTTDANASYVKPKGTVTIAMVTSTSWTESGLTYVNMPSTGEYVIAREITFDTATTWEFPVTSAVQKWMNGTTNRGFSIKSRNFSPDGQCYGTFYANELAPDGGPRLYVRWR